MKQRIGEIYIIACLVIIGTVLGLTLGMKSVCFFGAFFCYSFFLILWLTMVGNIMLGRDIEVTRGSAWWVILMTVGSVFLSVALCL